MTPKNQLTVVMYHYVRELTDSRFPDIKGLTIENFKKQLDYFQQYYTFVRMEDCLTCLETRCSLPKNAILLTFDDGYIDHYLHVFPILNERNIQGSFFPSAKAVLENCVLDVNKIHFIIASVKNKSQILHDIFCLIKKYKNQYDLDTPQDYVSRINVENRYDPKEVILIKCLLQYQLPYLVRIQIINTLYKKYINVSERVFSKELYMNAEQVKMMKRNGMFIGSHGYDHVWMNILPTDQQEDDVLRSMQFLDDLNVDINRWVMCYPYGVYNESLIQILKKHHCRLGLTTHVNIATFTYENAFVISRLDTNDFPVISNASMNQWTLKITDMYKT